MPESPHSGKPLSHDCHQLSCTTKPPLTVTLRRELTTGSFPLFQAGGAVAGAAAAAGAGSEMDLATILATFPPDVREEVLLTSEEDVINSLPPALLAEAQQLRQRVMQHYR